MLTATLPLCLVVSLSVCLSVCLFVLLSHLADCHITVGPDMFAAINFCIFKIKKMDFGPENLHLELSQLVEYQMPVVLCTDTAAHQALGVNKAVITTNLLGHVCGNSNLQYCGLMTCTYFTYSIASRKYVSSVSSALFL